MSSETYNKHLALEDRIIIETGIKNGSTKKAIADTIGKDPSTVGKEIKLHRIKSYKCSLPLECANYKKCKYGRVCICECMDYKPFICNRRDKSPGACNGCSNYTSCRFDKYRYDANIAESEYKRELKESREGFNLTTKEAESIVNVVSPLLKQGQSPYQIITNHNELGISEKTLYNYLEGGAFVNIKDGATNMDLRRQLSRKISKTKKNLYKKRSDKSYLQGRLYKDFLTYMNENPNAMKMEMDTVYNDVSSGPFVQTFKLISMQLIVAILHDERTSEEMLSGINVLDEVFGHSLFEKVSEVLVTDRGTEFVLAEEAEVRPDGTRRTRLFYCDPMQSGQKGSLENKHEMLRYILPKGCDLRAIGLVNQEALNLAISHINSTPVESLNGKTPLEYCKFMFPDLYSRLAEFGIVEIAADKVTLKPILLKQFIK